MNDTALDDYAAKIESLAVFATAAAGHNSRFGYQPVMNSREYAGMIQNVGRMAERGDRMAFLASQVVRSINLYGTQAQAHAAVFTALGEALRGEYRDIVGASGPEAGRPSDHRFDWTLADKIIAFAWAKIIVGDLSYGWALTDLAKRESILLPHLSN
jgi:hypothetical protein